ncbi:MAG: hypothetical protein RIS35_1890 [Pseudomonadota bacterium]|jgi:nucleotide-binding universal stress UspA family protein
MKFLIATDGSENSLRAVTHIVQLTGRLAEQASVTLVSVHDDVALRHAQRFVGKEAVDDYLRQLSEADLEGPRKVLDEAGIQHDMVIRTGHVAAEIATVGNDGGYDMIVLGSKGRSALKDLLVGSVPKRVIELAKVPVLLVP